MKESGFQFVQPYLNELDFKVNNQYNVDVELPHTIEMHNNLSVRIGRYANKSGALVTLILEVNKDSDNAPFQITASISSSFEWKSIDDEKIERMLRVNAPAVLLSYLRPIVAQITNSSQFPAYNIPLFNFVDQEVAFKYD